MSKISNMLSRFRSWVQQEISLHPKLYLLFQFAFFCLTAYWFFHPPAPGKAVLLLGVVAAIMTIQSSMTDKHRVGWILIVFVLFIVEFRAIDKDRREHDQQQADILKEERNSFSKILKQDSDHFDATIDGLKTAISNSDRQFKATMEKAKALLDTTQSISSLTKKNLTNITGGSSFGYLRPQIEGAGKGPIALVIWNHGDEILTGVTVSISRTQDPNWGAEFFKPYTVGTIAPHDMARLPMVIMPQVEPKSGIDSYWVMISAQNGTVDESLMFRKSKKNPNSWAMSFRVAERVRVDDKTEAFPILMLRGWSDEPNPEQKVDSIATQLKKLKRIQQRERSKRQPKK